MIENYYRLANERKAHPQVTGAAILTRLGMLHGKVADPLGFEPVHSLLKAGFNSMNQATGPRGNAHYIVFTGL